MAKSREIKHLSDLLPDEANANRGTERGLGMLEASLRAYGAGRSVLLDRNGRIIAGNKTVEQAAALGMDDLIVVKTDGRKLVAVQRTDLDMARDPRARELALADNRVGEVDLEWDPAVLAEMGKEIDLSPFWTEQELKDLLADSPVPQEEESGGLGGGQQVECPKCGHRFNAC